MKSSESVHTTDMADTTHPANTILPEDSSSVLFSSRRDVLRGLGFGALAAAFASAGLQIPKTAFAQENKTEGGGSAELRLKTGKAVKEQIAETLKNEADSAMIEAGGKYMGNLSDILLEYETRRNKEYEEVYPFRPEPADDPLYTNFAYPLLLNGADPKVVRATYTQHWQKLRALHIQRELDEIQKLSKKFTEALSAYYKNEDEKISNIQYLIAAIGKHHTTLIDLKAATLHFPEENSSIANAEQKTSTRYQFDLQQEWDVVKTDKSADQLSYLGQKLDEYMKLLGENPSQEEQSDLISAVIMITGWIKNLDQPASSVGTVSTGREDPTGSPLNEDEVGMEARYLPSMTEPGEKIHQPSVEAPPAKEMKEYDPSLFDLFERTFWSALIAQFYLELEAYDQKTAEHYNKGERNLPLFDAIDAFHTSIAVAREQLSRLDIDALYEGTEIDSPKREDYFYKAMEGKQYGGPYPYQYNRRFQGRRLEELMMIIMDQHNYRLKIPNSLDQERKAVRRRILETIDGSRSEIVGAYYKEPAQYKKAPPPKKPGKRDLFSYSDDYYPKAPEETEEHKIWRSVNSRCAALFEKIVLVTSNNPLAWGGRYNPDTDQLNPVKALSIAPEDHREHVHHSGRNGEETEWRFGGFHFESIEDFIKAVAGHEVANRHQTNFPPSTTTRE